MGVVAELTDVSVRRGDTLLLDEVNFKIEEGQRWLVMGPNGAGKTTMLRLLAAQMHPTTGVVSLLEEYLGAVDVFELRPRIGVCSAAISDRLPPSEKVRDVIVSSAYGVLGRWHEIYEQADYDRADELMQMVHVDQLAGRSYGTLSEGEQKRVEIARALMTDPELLLLDEPGAGLDLSGREILVKTLAQLFEDEYAPTTILVSHHVEEVPPGITHAALMTGGQIIFQGEIDEILTSEKMSRVFQMPLQIDKVDDRFTARAQRAARAQV